MELITTTDGINLHLYKQSYTYVIITNASALYIHGFCTVLGNNNMVLLSSISETVGVYKSNN